MSLAKTTVSAAVLTLMLGAPFAYADDQPATRASCISMDKEVVAALDANGQSSNVYAARDELRMGRNACRTAFFKIGIVHFKNALELLGHS